MLRVKIPKLINVIGTLVTKGFLVLVIYRLSLKDQINGINYMNGWW
jgi:hypothetical protein